MVSATAVAEVGTPIKSMQYHWADSEEVGVVPEEAVATKYTFHRLVTYFAIVIAGYVTSTIRAKVLHMLVSKLAPGIAHFAKRMISYSADLTKTSDAITINFMDGTIATCDLLVAADGFNSSTRKQLFRDTDTNVEPVYMGRFLHNKLVPF